MITLHNELDRSLSILWRFKGTILIQIVIITIGLLVRDQTIKEHRQLLHRFGFDYDLLRDGQVWRLLTGTWIQANHGTVALSMILLVLTGTVFLEYFVGTRAMLLTVVLGDWIATILTSLTLRALTELNISQATGLLSTPDSGTSALAHAGYGAAIMMLPRGWLKLAVAALVMFTLMQFFVVDLDAALVHFWAAAYGMCVGWFLLRPHCETHCENRSRSATNLRP